MNNRASNFELLRLIAIYGIIVHHLVINSANTCGYNEIYSFEKHGLGGVTINSFVICGVNLFVLISGWFGIRRIYKNIILLIADCIIFGIISLSICFFIFDCELDLSSIYNTIKPTRLWFIVHYIVLVLISPLLEKTLKDMSHQELTKWIIILTVINVFFGYYLGLCNKDGYNYINFIYLYYIGRYLHLSSRTGFYKILAKYGLLCWIIFSLSEVTLFVFLYHQNLLPDSVRFWSYNSPWVLVTSVCLFMWISLLNIKSNTINILSSSTLGIYIIHTAPPPIKIQEFNWSKYLRRLWIYRNFIICFNHINYMCNISFDHHSY